MKQTILVSISLLLIIVAILCPPTTIKPEIVAGAGNGKNAEIKNAEDFVAVLDLFGNGSGYSANSSNSGIESMAKLIKKSNHTSGTLNEESHLSSLIYHKSFDGYSISGEPLYSNYGKSTTSFNRSLTLFLDGDKSYYVTKGVFKNEYDPIKITENNVASSIDYTWEIEMFIDGNDLYIKFINFILKKDNKDVCDVSEILGKWVKIPDEAAYEMIGFVDELNRSNLSKIQNMFDEEFCDEIENKEIYTKSLSVLEENDTELIIDFSDTESSSICIKTDGAEDGSNISQKDLLVFYNIDNTVIKADIENYVDLDMDDCERIFGGDE